MARDPWLVPVTTLRRVPGSARREVRVGRVGELEVAESKVAADSEVRAEVVLCSLDGGVEVEGTVTSPWEGQCRRCLSPVRGVIDCEVRELYRPRRRNEKPDEDEETYPLESEMLDLRPLVRDALLLELPVAPLCSEDCAGLCSACGANRNDAPCGCSSPG